MVNKPVDVRTQFSIDEKAEEIYALYQSYSIARSEKVSKAKETYEYLYATSTKDIKEQTNLTAWAQDTHLPKLTQLRDTLTNMYKSYLFSIRNYLEWDGFDSDSNSVDNKKRIRDFAQDMFDRSDLKGAVETLLDDYVEVGEAFVTPVYEEVDETISNTQIARYELVRAERIDPFDIFYDVTYKSFKATPKIIRKVVSLGELKELAERSEEMQKAFNAVMKNRETYSMLYETANDLQKDQLAMGGLGSLSNYTFGTDVEILTFYGDFYNITEDKLDKNKRIMVVNGTTVFSEVDQTIEDTILRVGWRERKNILSAMGPLENLLGMQYRIDFLENLRAEIFDALANPIMVEHGDVQLPPELKPGAIIHTEGDGSVNYLSPPTIVLEADSQIDKYERKMEQYVGITQDTMGVRTPGEKTAFEYNGLVTSGVRNIEQQVRHFEKELFQPLVNLLLKVFVLHKGSEKVSVKDFDEDAKTVIYKDIILDEMLLTGKLKAVGSLTYAEKSRIATTLADLNRGGFFQDEAIRNHFSPKQLAKTLAYSSGLETFGVYKENARIFEMVDQQRAESTSKDQIDSELAYNTAQETATASEAEVLPEQQQPPVEE